MSEQLNNPTTHDEWSEVVLSDIDPSLSTIPAGFYDLRVTKVTFKTFAKKSGEGTYSKVFITFGVTNHDQHSGRRVTGNYFKDQGLKYLRLIQDNSDVPQEPGESIVDWGKRLVAEGLPVKLYVNEIPDLNYDGTKNEGNIKADGSAGNRNEIDWKRGIQPAG